MSRLDCAEPRKAGFGAANALPKQTMSTSKQGHFNPLRFVDWTVKTPERKKNRGADIETSAEVQASPR